jgi:hypothetical protein
MKILPGIFTIALLIASTQAQTSSPAPKRTPTPAPIQKPGKHVSLIYHAPGKAVAGVRHDIDAGSRGWSAKMPLLYVLAPDHTGLTTRAQPALFWYQSGPASTRIEVTVIEPGKPKPVLRVGADKVDQPGIHRLLLARYNVNLAPGVVYKWTVALVPDPANRSQDVIASDTIQRAEPGAQFTTALAGAEGLDRAALYARQGIWYDALEAVTKEIDAAPKDKELRFQRAALLEQAGLQKVAASERQ